MIARRILAAGLVVLVVGVVFSPLVAALVGGRVSGAGAAHGVGGPLGRSVVVAAVAAAVAIGLGFPFAVLVDRGGVGVRGVGWGLAVVALIVPPYIVAESTIVLFGPAGKVSRGVALLLGVAPAKTDVVGRARFVLPGLVYSPVAAGGVMGGCLFPIVALAVGGANRRTDRRIFESARLMRGRAGVARVMARVLVPPAVGGGLLVLGLALTESVVPQLLRVRTAGEAIYERIEQGDLPGAAGLSLPLLPMILLAGTGGVFILVRSRSASLAGLEGEVPKFVGGTGGGAKDLVGLCVAGVAVVPAVVVPAVGLGWLMWTATLPDATGEGHRLLRASGFVQSLGGAWDLARGDAMRTMGLAAVAASVGVGLSVALVRAMGRTRWAAVVGGLGAGLAVPGPVVALGLIVLWNRGGGVVYQSAMIVLLAWLARFLPVGVLLVQAALARVPVELEEAAALSGRGWVGRFVSVVLPAAGPGLVAAWLAVYVLSATEFAATLLVVPAGESLLAPSVVNLMRRGQDSEIAACQVLLLAVVAAPVVVLAIGAALVGRRRA